MVFPVTSKDINTTSTNEMKNPLVSIITPMYKGGKFIGETIQSVLHQTYSNWEHIIVDDCSPDGGEGIKVVKKFMANDARIRLAELETNRGSSGARNQGIKAARGEILAFLDADDLWFETYLEKQLAFMREKKATIVFSSYKRIDEANEKEIFSPFIVPSKANYHSILKSLPIFPSTSMLDIREIGKFYFDESMGCMRDDYVFWLNILKNHVTWAHGNKEVLASYRMRSDSVTANKMSVIKPHWNVLRNVEKTPLIKCTFYMFCWICISLFKYRR